MKMFFRFSKKQAKPGFSLPEIIVGISILVLTVVASTNLLISILKSNTENINTLIGYQLAQEGLEGMRNIRDSNWLLAADFDGTISGNKVWQTSLPKDVGITQYFILDYNQLSFQGSGALPAGTSVRASEISVYAPWKLTAISDQNGDPDLNKAQMYEYAFEQTGGNEMTYYVHDNFLSQKKSAFGRYMKVEALGLDQEGQVNPSKVYKYQVTSVVFWKEGNREKEIRLTTELTDWKGGPL